MVSGLLSLPMSVVPLSWLSAPLVVCLVEVDDGVLLPEFQVASGWLRRPRRTVLSEPDLVTPAWVGLSWLSGFLVACQVLVYTLTRGVLCSAEFVDGGAAACSCPARTSGFFVFGRAPKFPLSYLLPPWCAVVALVNLWTAV